MRHRYGRGNLLLEIGLVVAAVAYMVPFYVVVTVSLGLPGELDASSYSQAWRDASLGEALVSSVAVTAISVGLLVLIGSTAAYVLARRGTRLSQGVYLVILAGILAPLQLALVPLYQLMRDAGLLGSYTSLVAFYTGHMLPLTVFLYTGFLRALPSTYEEAAHVDGATSWQAFRRIVFPLLRPVTGTVIILDVIFVWNDFLTPLLYTAGTAQQTLPVAIYSFVGEYTSQWALIFAGLVLGMAPVLVVFFALQKHVIRGFASGVKG